MRILHFLPAENIFGGCWFGVNETGIDGYLISVEKSSAAREKKWENIDFSPPSLRSAHERELPFLSRFIAVAVYSRAVALIFLILAYIFWGGIVMW